MLRKGKRLLCLAMAGLLCWSVSAQALAEEVPSGDQGQTEFQQPADDGTVSGSDGAVNGGGVNSPEEGNTEYVTEVVDVSSMVYQAGGFGTPVREDYGIAMFAISAEDQLKSAILGALSAGEITLDISDFGLTTSDQNELMVLFSEVLNENPDFFYVKAGLGFSYNPSTSALINISFDYGDATEAEKQEFSRKLNEAAALVTPDMTEEEKALVLHDYLVQHCAYAYQEFMDKTLDSCPNVYDAYGALVRGKAVCQGYALAYGALLRKVGIPAYMSSSQSMNHAWNVVLINGNWYHVDTTWDDPTWNTEGKARHEYFLLSDAEMGNRQHENWVDSVDCTSTAYDNSYWWRDINSQIVQAGHDDYIYIKDAAGGTFQVVRKTGGAAEQVLYTSTAVWSTGAGGFWPAQAYLSRIGDQVYFNDDLNVYSMGLAGGTPQKVYTYDQGGGSIYGAMVYEDGTARLNIDTTPNRGSDSYISVKLKEVVRVTGITLDQSSVTLKEGESLNLTAVVAPENADNRNVVWRSSDETVASVTGGAVTALKGGTAVITAVTRDGGFTASCTVTVICASHTLTKVDAVAPTCETDGAVEYWTCSRCGRNYADAAGTSELADADLVQKATGHTVPWGSDETGHWGTCSVCGKVIEKEAHTYADEVATDCSQCGYRRAYKIISGADATYETGSEAGLTISADGEFSLFQDIEIDGKIVDKANYEVREGSTIVTLKKAYLDTLSKGSHSIRFLYTDGKSASTQFELKAGPDGGSNGSDDAENDEEESNDGDGSGQNYASAGPGRVTAPKTGDVYHPVQLILMIGACVSVIAGILVYKRRSLFRQENGSQKEE